MAHDAVPLVVIQPQLGHANLGVTSILSARHRQFGDRQHRPLPACAGHLSHRRAHSEALSPTRRAADAARLPFPRNSGAGLRTARCAPRDETRTDWTSRKRRAQRPATTRAVAAERHSERSCDGTSGLPSRSCRTASVIWPR
jgi:hypothetical protein